MKLKILNQEKYIWWDSVFILRLWIGIVFIYYGAALFDASQMKQFSDYLSSLGFSHSLFWAYLSKTFEFFGGIFLAAGLFTRFSCVPHIVNMFVATFIANKADVLGNGQFTFLLLVALLVIFLSKKDYFSLDMIIIHTKTKN